MRSSILNTYFADESELYGRHLIALFEQLEAINNLFYAVLSFEGGAYKLAYISPSVQCITGYPLEQFSYDFGYRFMNLIAESSCVNLTFEKDTIPFLTASSKDRSTTKPFFLSTEAIIKRADSSVVSAQSAGIILHFAPEHVPGLAIVAMHVVDDLIPTSTTAIAERVKAILLNIDAIYSLLYDLKLSPLYGDALVKSGVKLYNMEELTKQEHRVLKLLADGRSTKSISGDLNVSYHTAETHRRHLLHKFKAANIAELIKKATKLYWYE